ncbi:zinc-dependent alcohol dehydrogenase [Microlunatus soli]|uniref:L-idonate 5-dehydrogenase n=1 Tax=Microlunatus soli TaxID=630515 RepID=A0A1H1RTR5_9ACTN|nr:alcohol dehydrogenase catalytic domain-containing protein [Microlunatus soli]SDS39127.1 L-idonate 5-dehydrogenase [Microlunatus soli]
MSPNTAAPSSHSALVLDRDLRLHVDQVPDRPPGNGEVLVEVAWTGICGSDLHVVQTGDWVTSWPAILGHEVCGRVLDCPDAALPTGQPVVLDSRVPCGRCRGCERAANLCSELAWLGECRPGGYQQRVVVPVSSVVALPADLPLDVAVLAEPLAVAQHAVHRTVRAAASLRTGWGPELVEGPGNTPFDRLREHGTTSQTPPRCLILGGGPIGQLVALLMSDAGHPIRVVEPDPGRRRLAAALGATVSESIPAGASWPVVIDAAGYPRSLPDALAAVERGGIVTVVALAHHPVELTPADLVEHETIVIGSSGFDDELPIAVTTLTSDPSRFRPLITEALELPELPDRLQRWRQEPPTGKVVIRP